MSPTEPHAGCCKKDEARMTSDADVLVEDGTIDTSRASILAILQTVQPDE